MQTIELNHPAYQERIRLPGYNGKVSVTTAVTSSDAGKVLRRLKPDWSIQDHQQLAMAHLDKSKELKAAWNKLADEAAQETFGRPFAFTDYQISGCANSQFTLEKQNALRNAAHGKSFHRVCGAAHAAAAKSLIRSAAQKTTKQLKMA